MKYKTESDLKEVYSFIDEADLALADKTRKITDSSLSKAIAAGAVASGVISAGMLTTSAIGLLTPLAPIFIAEGLFGLIFASIKKKKNTGKVQKAKELAYKQAIEKQNAIIKALKEETNADKERIEYLVGLNKLLTDAILELQNDLKQYQERG